MHFKYEQFHNIYNNNVSYFGKTGGMSEIISDNHLTVFLTKNYLNEIIYVFIKQLFNPNGLKVFIFRAVANQLIFIQVFQSISLRLIT